jgi:O-6-methylguanine DNA methyltransferase
MNTHHLQAAALRQSVWDSPLGPIELWASGSGLVRVGFPATAEAARRWALRHLGAVPAPAPPDDALLGEARRQLGAYLRGDLRAFDLALDLRGTPFQQTVWRALLAIPWGATCSYRDLAARIGQPSAVRAVGAANGANPISIIVPCHRVVASDGALRGYSGGLELKRALLAIEGRTARH